MNLWPTMTEFQYGYRCTICSPPEYERVVAEISFNGEVLCTLLRESDEGTVEVKFERAFPPLVLEDFTLFAAAAAAYLKDGHSERPELALARAMRARPKQQG